MEIIKKKCTFLSKHYLKPNRKIYRDWGSLLQRLTFSAKKSRQFERQYEEWWYYICDLLIAMVDNFGGVFSELEWIICFFLGRFSSSVSVRSKPILVYNFVYYDSPSRASPPPPPWQDQWTKYENLTHARPARVSFLGSWCQNLARVNLLQVVELVTWRPQMAMILNGA